MTTTSGTCAAAAAFNSSLTGEDVQNVRVLSLLPLGVGGGLLRLGVKDELKAAAAAQVPELSLIHISHVMAFATEHARLTGQVVDVAEFERRVMRGELDY